MSVLSAAAPRSSARAVVGRVPPLLIDLLIAAAAEASVLWGVAASQQALITQNPPAPPWPWWVWAAAALLPPGLLGRRRAPYATFWYVGGGMLALSITDNLAITWNHSSEFMLLVAMATVAYFCTGWKFWTAAVASVAANVVAVEQAFARTSIEMLIIVMAFVAGRLAARQRDLAALMADRAHQAELTSGARAAQAAAEERTRIARDMHDILAHAVSLMIVQAEAGAAVVKQHPEKAERAFDAIADGGRDALTQLRRMLGVLREDDALALTPQPTLAELPRLVGTVRAARIDVRMVVEGLRRPLPRDTEVALYRTVQEALTNTVKHARATRAEVRLDWTPQTLTLRVTDDGIGPRPGDPGRGLIGIRERISACGGSVQAGPGPDGRGFQVLVGIPAATTAEG
jgi:signal transduction histidine kinase